uniref:Uncharacterized protein n=1 Tax=Kalanchoe fedtschenkoi TaxID=63787 RepID=A0A7N0T7H3_KALFE
MSRRNTSSYAKVSRSSGGGASCRGFRLRYSRRFSVQAFRARFLLLFRILNKWKYTYCRALKFLKRGMYGGGGAGDRRIGKVSEFGSSRSMNEFIPRSHECRMRSFGRSNSFYSEAIADCLEFIKRTSVSDKEEDEKQPVNNGFQKNLSGNVNGLCEEEKMEESVS